ncbi:MAG: hypothetical protein K8T20_06940 [Planctomycetes bacterium]|nr:hypothetical protein [Planctomycetota bacterium]
MSAADATPAEKPRRRPVVTPLHLLFLLGLLVVVSIPLIVIGAAMASRSGWEMLAHKLQADIARQQAVKGLRSPLEGTAEPGNAWDDYPGAMLGFPSLSSTDEDLLVKCVDQPITAEAEIRLTAILDAATPAMDRIAALAHRERARRAVEWEKGVDAKSDSVEARNVARHFCADARRWGREGNLDRALDRLAVVLQLALDVSRPDMLDHLIGLAILQYSTAELHRLLVDLPWTSAQLERADRLLLEVDRQLPSLAESTEANAILDCVSLRKLAEGEIPSENVGVGSRDRGMTAWRKCFSWKLLALEAAGQVQALVEVARKTEGLEWGTAKKEWEAHEKKCLQSRNKISEAFLLAYGAAEQSHRKCLARLRLLRCLIREKQGLPPAPIEDPFSRKSLQRLATPTTLKIWSVGVDGDQGGLGSFDPLKGDENDIVIEIDRK